MQQLSRFGAALTALILIATACSASAEVAAERQLPSVTATPTVAAQAEFAPTVAAEADPGDPSPPAQPTPTVLPTPTTVPTATAIPTPTPGPPGPCDAGPLAPPDPNRPVYDAVIDVDPVARTVTGSLRVAFTPDLDVENLYLRLWPNGPRPASGGVELSINNTTVDGEQVSVSAESPTTVKVATAQAIAAGETVVLATDFELVVPVELKARLSGRDDYMRLGTILPILPWEAGRGWALEAATPLFAESVSSPTADYTVDVRVPEGYDVLASGMVDDDGVWRVEAARDFALSVGRFRTVSAIAMAPEPVQVIVGVHETIDDNPDDYLRKIVDSLEQFSDRWGQYPWPSLTFAVTPNLSGGIEFPTHIMQGPDTTGRVTSHEVGHMFFYSLVGNNQGAAPWLDEGLASYAEFTYERTPANAFPIPAGGVGNATQPMSFWEARSEIYYRSVYAQSGFALQLLGDRIDVDCALARYVATNAYAIATAEDFVAAFEPTFPGIIEQMAALGVVIDPN